MSIRYSQKKVSWITRWVLLSPDMALDLYDPKWYIWNVYSHVNMALQHDEKWSKGFVLSSERIAFEFFFLLNVCASWNFIKNRTILQELLNSTVELDIRHRHPFGGLVHVSKKYFLIYFLRECFSLIWKLVPYPVFYVLYIRFSLTAYLTDMAMILYCSLIKSLATHLAHLSLQSCRGVYVFCPLCSGILLYQEIQLDNEIGEMVA